VKSIFFVSLTSRQFFTEKEDFDKTHIRIGRVIDRDGLLDKIESDASRELLTFNKCGVSDHGSRKIGDQQ